VVEPFVLGVRGDKREVDLAVGEIDADLAALGACMAEDFDQTERIAVELRQLFLPVGANRHMPYPCHARSVRGVRATP
jgi:hypothetical protein